VKKDEDFINVRRMIANKNPKILKWLPGFVIRYIERILHQNRINNFLHTHTSKNQDFCADALVEVGLNYTIKGIENIPKTGKCVLAMNHPLGGMDAIILVDALKNHRTDIKFIVNDLLLHLKPLEGIFVGVNKIGKVDANSLQKVNDLFASDQLVCVFPAGMVSRKQKGIISDLVWKKTFIRLAKANDSTIVPIHIEGKLTNWFYRLSNFRRFIGIKANIEMLYLSDEMFKQKGQTISFTVGEPIIAKSLDDSKTEIQWSEWFRQHIYSLPKK
jgi:putative hemolysin